MPIGTDPIGTQPIGFVPSEVSDSVNLVGAVGTTAAGSLGKSDSLLVIGATATSAAGSPTKEVEKTPPAAAATATAVAVSFDITSNIDLSGAQCYSSCGGPKIEISSNISLTGAYGTSAAAPIPEISNVVVLGTYGTATAGITGVTTTTNLDLIGQVGTTAVGTLATLTSPPLLTGAEGDTAANSLVVALPGGALAAAISTTSAGTLSVSDQPAALAGATATSTAGQTTSEAGVGIASVSMQGAAGQILYWASSQLDLSGAQGVSQVGAFITGHLRGVSVATAAGAFSYQWGLVLEGADGTSAAAFVIHEANYSVVAVTAAPGANTFTALIFVGPTTPVVLLLEAAIAGNAPILGCYEADRYFDLGYPGNLAIGVSFLGTGTAATDSFLSQPGFLNISDFVGSASASSVTSWCELNIGTDGTDGIVWGGWQKYVPGVYSGRYVNRRWWVQAPSNQIQGSLADASSQCSVEDRVDHYQNFTVGTDGYPITFTPDGSSTPAPFNSGLNGSDLPTLYPPIWNQTAGDIYQFSGFSLSGITLAFFNGGSPVERTVQTFTVAGF